MEIYMKFKQEKISSEVFVGVLNKNNVDKIDILDNKNYYFINFNYNSIDDYISLSNKISKLNIIIGKNEIDLLENIKFNERYIDIYNCIYNSYITYQLIFNNNSIITLTNCQVDEKIRKADELTKLTNIENWNKNYDGRLGYIIFPSYISKKFRYCESLESNSEELNLKKITGTNI
jgi:hypothetical protein